MSDGAIKKTYKSICRFFDNIFGMSRYAETQAENEKKNKELGEKLDKLSKDVEEVCDIRFKKDEDLSSELKSFSSSLNLLQSSIANLNGAVASSISQIEEMKVSVNNMNTEVCDLKQNIIVIKSGLQKELYESLTNCRDKCTARGWATNEEKDKARMIYNEIHNLGKNGFSEECMRQIIELPSSRREYYEKMGGA